MHLLGNPIIDDVEQLFMCFFFLKPCESDLFLEIWFLQFCLVFKSFSITYPKTFFEYRCHLHTCRLVNFSAPKPRFSSCCFRNGHKAAGLL